MEETGYLLDKGNELSASVMSAELTNELSASVMSAELTKSRIQDDIPFQYSGTSISYGATQNIQLDVLCLIPELILLHDCLYICIVCTFVRMHILVRILYIKKVNFE